MLRRLLLSLTITLSSPLVLAVSSKPSNVPDISNDLLWFGVLLLFAVLSLLVTKLKQPAVLGQILVGVFISCLAHYKIAGLQNITHSPIIIFLAELGSIFLLFEIGLESNIHEIKHAGLKAVIVAILGAVIPFIIGFFIVTPYILHSDNSNLALFMGSILAVTSTGISISVLKDLGLLQSQTAKLILTASVIDDIIGLILLSTVTGIITSGVFNLAEISQTLLSAVIFFICSLIIGILILPRFIDGFLIRISKEQNIIMLILVALCMIMSWFAHSIGLASIIGAFIAGLFLEDKLFAKYKYKGIPNLGNKTIASFVEPFGQILTPIFFIFAGMQIDIIGQFSWDVLFTSILITILAIAGKLVCGIFLPKNINKWLVGFGMTPRGEIGIIFAITGLQLGIINNKIFTAILLMVIFTSIITPIAITNIHKRMSRST